MQAKQLFYVGAFLVLLAGIVIFDQWRTHGTLYDLKEIMNHEVLAAILFSLGLPCLLLGAKK